MLVVVVFPSNGTVGCCCISDYNACWVLLYSVQLVVAVCPSNHDSWSLLNTRVT